MLVKILCCLSLINTVYCFELTTCNKTEYLDPSLLACQACPSNVSMIASADGFSCVCEAHAVPAGPGRCKPCGPTEVVSADGRACVPRKCHGSGGRHVCRKCPNDYISLTQNVDGSPAKEVTCVRCARGYRPERNACVRCEACACARGDVAVGGACVPSRHLAARPKYEDNHLHPNALLEIVRDEYLCLKGDLVACRKLASACVRNFYVTELAGPCRLWIQPKITPKGLPDLLVKPVSSDLKPGEFILPRGKGTLSLVVAVYTCNGGLKMFKALNDSAYRCSLPTQIKVGTDFSLDCEMNITQLSTLDQNSTFSPYLEMDGELKPLPILVRTPSNQYAQRGVWSSNNFRRYFLVDNFLTLAANVTGTVYLRTMLVRIRIERGKQSGSLHLHVGIEAQYASKSAINDMVTTTLTVLHEMPSAGIFRGLEIWGGVLGSLLSLYAVVQWRGELRRGGLHFSFVPLIAGAIADALYFAAWLSTLHALAAEAGTLGMTLPLSRAEERIIRAFVYAAVSLKALRIVWINWKQCRNDIFFLDWSEYNTAVKDGSSSMIDDCGWKAATLGREWSRLQTQRRAPPSYTVTLTLFMLQLMVPWRSYLPQSQGYRWAIANIAWISAYSLLISLRWALDRLRGPPSALLPKVCSGAGISLLVFQEEYYAHYIHGRNDDCKDLRLMAGPLSMCRIVMAAPLRIVYKQLSSPGVIDDLGNTDARRVILTRLLAAFFERALDGLNWVASERTILERLLGVELTEREGGATSVLLYDPDDSTPSCTAVTWWGEEWTLGTFDTMLFGSVVICTDNMLLAAFVTIVIWQIMKRLRIFFGARNQRYKTNIICSSF